jgi:hypothetical protein
MQLLSAFWLVFSGDIDIYGHRCHQLFELALLVIKQMLNSRNRVVLSSLKAVGLGQQLARIIQLDADFLTSQNELDLMEIVENYVTLESRFGKRDFSGEINGKNLLEMEKAEKQVLMAFCLNAIDLRHEQCYCLALGTLIAIFERHEYLIDCIANYAPAISALIDSPIAGVQMRAVELTDDLVYHQDSIACDLLRNSYLPDLLYEALLQHRRQPNESTSAFCCIVSNILCNLAISKNRNKEELARHPIWELAYENIHMGSPFLPLITAFEYLFEILPRKACKEFL